MTLYERRSGIDSRPEAERALMGERRSGTDRRTPQESATPTPSGEQLATFVRRLKRTMRDEKGRSFFGVAVGEGDFSIYPDVLRVVEWLEHLTGNEHQSEFSPPPALRKPPAL